MGYSGKNKSVLFVSYAYPPSSSPGAVRLGRITARTGKYGFLPFVLTVGKRVGQRNSGLEIPLSEDLLIRIDDPLAGLSDAVESASSDEASQSMLKSFAHGFMIPDKRIFWARRLRAADGKVDKISPAIIVTSSPDISTHFVGQRLAKRTGAKWIAEFRDPVSWLSKTDETLKIKRYLLAKIEAWVVRKADVTVTISDAFSEYFRKQYPDADIRTIANGAEVDADNIQRNVANVRKRTAEGPLNITHAGSLYGGVRNPEPLIIAAKLAQQQTSRPIKLHFIGGDSHLAQSAAEKQSVPGMVIAHGSKGHGETVAMTENADGLVALLHDDPVARIGIMSKFFDYVATGNPVLVVGEEQAMLCRIVEDEQAGRAHEYDDVQGMAKWITELADNPEQMRPDALKICKKWSADSMASSMTQLFDELAGD